MNLWLSAFGFGLVTASILAIASVGFTMQFGITNILNLAYGDIMTAAAFIGLIANHMGMNVWVCLVVGAVFGAGLSVALNRFVYAPFLRRGLPLFGIVIISISVALIIQNTVLAVGGPNFFSYQFDPGQAINILGMDLTPGQLAVIGIAVVAMMSIHSILAWTRLGKAMRATASNLPLARSSGVRVNRTIDIAWAISGALCGIAGVVLVINTASFAASTGASFLVVIIAAAVLGGVGSPYGAMAGALAIGLATEMSAVVINPAYKEVVAFAILVAVLLLRPQGIITTLRAPVAGSADE